MKKSLLLFCIIFSINYLAVAQPCPTSISFETQAEIDNFQYDYPGCTSIEGNVTIGTGISNLNGLSVLTYIGGHLRIENTDITDLTGLEGLSFIDADLWIDSNPNLTSLNGLEGLDSVGQGIVISDNNALTSLEGFGSLVSAGNGLFIEDNAALVSLSGLDSFTSAGGRLEIENNDVLTDLSSLAGVISVEDQLTLLDNDLLDDLYGLHNIQSVGWDLTVEKNRSLTSLDGLNNLSSISKSLRIIENEKLTDLTGLNQLSLVGETLEIRDNYELMDISSLANISQSSLINLSIFNNPALSDCHIQPICEYLSDPNGKVIIHHNGEGCNYVVEIGSACGISLPCLPFGDYYFIKQEYIDNFPGDFPECEQLQGNLVINGADITTLDGLQQVTSIGADLQFLHNSSLTSLDQLYNLTYLGKALVLIDNGQITSLEGINNIDLNEPNSLFITDNENLSVCSQDNICFFINNFGGQTSLGNNAPGCDNIYQIAADCGVLFAGHSLENEKIIVSPNPFSTSAAISISLSEPSAADLKIYDAQGTLVYRHLNEQASKEQHFVWYAGYTSPGVYVYRIYTNDRILTGKLILLR